MSKCRPVMWVAVDCLLEQAERPRDLTGRRPGYLIGAQIQVVGGEVVCRAVGGAHCLSGLERRFDHSSEGWLYLAVILDLFTRKVVGWAMREHMRAELTIAALIMAIQRRRPGAGLAYHSDSKSVPASCSWAA
jgi:transposase InsO family protein